jgi:hypothetical protein
MPQEPTVCLTNEFTNKLKKNCKKTSAIKISKKKKYYKENLEVKFNPTKALKLLIIKNNFTLNIKHEHYTRLININFPKHRK